MKILCKGLRTSPYIQKVRLGRAYLIQYAIEASIEVLCTSPNMLSAPLFDASSHQKFLFPVGDVYKKMPARYVSPKGGGSWITLTKVKWLDTAFPTRELEHPLVKLV